MREKSKNWVTGTCALLDVRVEEETFFKITFLDLDDDDTIEVTIRDDVDSLIEKLVSKRDENEPRDGDTLVMERQG